MSIGSRIKERREQLGMTQPQLADALGVSKGAIGNYETDANSPKASILYKVFDVLQCDANYIFQDEVKERKEWVPSQEEIDIIKRIRSLDDYGKRAVLYLIEHENGRVEQIARARDESEPETNNIVYIGRTSNKASAGIGFTLDYGAMERWGVKDNELTSRADLIVEVDGDSMEPDFHDGDNILVLDNRSVEVGEIGLFVVYDELGEPKGYVKKYGVNRYGRPVLISLNKKYKDFIPDELECVGRVLGVLDPDWIVKT